MTMNVDQQILDRLWGPELKVISAEFDAGAVRGALGTEARDLGIEHVVFHPGADGEAASLQSAAPSTPHWTTMPTPPSGLCLLVVASDQGLTDLDELRSWWAQKGSAPSLPILDLRGELHRSDDDETARSARLYRHLFRMASQEARCSAERQAQLQGDVCELRREYSLVRLSTERLQERLERLGHAVPSIIHFMPPGNESFRPRGGENTTLRQPLPVPAEGVAGVELYSSQPAGQGVGQGHLAVLLRARDSDAVLTSWLVSYSDLGAGWFRCVADRALTSLQHHLELGISWHTTKGEPPALTLSPIGAFHELAAVVGDKPLPQAVSMVVWGALPGSRLHSSSGVYCCDVPGSTGVIEYQLDPHTIARIQPRAEANIPYFHPLPDVPGFRLHPLDHTLATALLPHGCLPGTDRLVATAEIRMPEAKYPVEYAMCLTDAAAHCMNFPKKPKTDTHVLGFSGWQAVPADGQPHAVALTLPGPLHCAADLHFATRMADGQPMINHWADWLEVRIRLHRGTVVAPTQESKA
ncbi:MAG TPA: DUF6212 domain-containing protein [Phycisphaerae bacterium]|nr:DUF6212 domain-containing protein [Phycisphaerae bacterium]